MDKRILWLGIALVCLAGTMAGILLGPVTAVLTGTAGAAVLAVWCWRSCHAPATTPTG